MKKQTYASCYWQPAACHGEPVETRLTTFFSFCHRELVERRYAAFCSCLLLLSLLLLSATSRAQYTVIPIAGNDTAGYYGNGVPARQASLFWPFALCRDSVGNLYVGDGAGGGWPKYGRVRRIDAATGMITNIAGNGSYAPIGDSVDNAPATTARLITPFGLCIDHEGKLLIANGDGRVRRVNLATGIITTIAGDIMVLPGYGGDGGPATAARLATTTDVAVDRANNVYVLEGGNGTVRRIDAVTGIITTVAGTGITGYSGDGGPATAAQIGGSISGLYIDSADNIFIADRSNHRIRRVDAVTGIIKTIAGNPSATSHGDGGPATAAQLLQPARMTMDRAGNLFFTELGTPIGPRTSRIDAVTGIITTIAGDGGVFISDSTGDYGPATAVTVGAVGICMDTCGNFFITGGRHRIRALVPTVPTGDWLCGMKLTHPVTGINDLQGNVPQGLTVAPNPSRGVFMLTVSSPADEPVSITITDITGRVVQRLSMQTNKETPMELKAPPGLYLVTASTPGGRVSAKIVVQ